MVLAPATDCVDVFWSLKFRASYRMPVQRPGHRQNAWLDVFHELLLVQFAICSILFL